jgi:hypothetical protein
MAFHKTAAQDHAIRELQGKATTVVAGAAATTDIAVTGIAVGDTLGSVLMFAAGVPSDVSSEASITSAGNIQLSTTDSTGNQLVVEWYAHVGS